MSQSCSVHLPHGVDSLVVNLALPLTRHKYIHYWLTHVRILVQLRYFLFCSDLLFVPMGFAICAPTLCGMWFILVLKGTKREILSAMHVKELIQSNHSER